MRGSLMTSKPGARGGLRRHSLLDDVFVEGQIGCPRTPASDAQTLRSVHRRDPQGGMKRLPRSSGQAASALGSLDPESHRGRLVLPQMRCAQWKAVICRSRATEKLTFLQRLEHEPVPVVFSSQLRVDGSNQAVKWDLPPRRGRPHNVILQSGESWLGSGGELAGEFAGLAFFRRGGPSIGCRTRCSRVNTKSGSVFWQILAPNQFIAGQVNRARAGPNQPSILSSRFRSSSRSVICLRLSRSRSPWRIVRSHLSLFEAFESVRACTQAEGLLDLSGGRWG